MVLARLLKARIIESYLLHFPWAYRRAVVRLAGKAILRTSPKTQLVAILSLSKGGGRLPKPAPFDELRVLAMAFG
jgi:hypothetical protein